MTLEESARLERDVCRLAHRFAQSLDAHARRVGDRTGLTATQVVALRELSEPITARELADRLSCEASNATFVLDRLADGGLIERRPHPTDRRAKQIVLTTEGRERRAEVLELMAAHTPLGSLSGPECEDLRGLLARLVEPNDGSPSRIPAPSGTPPRPRR